MKNLDVVFLVLIVIISFYLIYLKITNKNDLTGNSMLILGILLLAFSTYLIHQSNRKKTTELKNVTEKVEKLSEMIRGEQIEKGEILFDIGDSKEINFIYGRKNIPFRVSENEDENFEHTLESFHISTGSSSEYNENDKAKLDFLKNKGINLGNSSIKSMFYLDHPFTFFIKKNLIALSSIIRDEDNNIVFEMDKGDWALKKNNNFSINYDETAIELIDSKGYVRFQIEIIENTLIYKGLLYKNEGVWVFSDAITDGKVFISNDTPNFEYHLDNLASKNLRIFKHVGSKYLKTRVTNKNLKRRYERLRHKKILEVRRIFNDYSGLSVKEIGNKTREFINNLKKLNERWKTYPEIPELREGESSEQIFLKHNQKMIDDYKKNFNTEAISLRYELDYRTKNLNSNLYIEDFYYRISWTTPEEIIKDLETLLFFVENIKDYSQLSNFELKKKNDELIEKLKTLIEKYGESYYTSNDFFDAYDKDIKIELISILFQIKNKKGIIDPNFRYHEYEKYESYIFRFDLFRSDLGISGYKLYDIVPQLESYSDFLTKLKD